MGTPPFIDPEHCALDRVLAEVEFFAQKRRFTAAARRFAEFRKALEAHLEEEENVIFPDFERRTGDPFKALPIIRAQHANLLVALVQIGAALERSDYAEVCTRLGTLDRALREHQSTEERLLPEHVAAQPASA